MNKNYLWLVALLLILVAGLFILPERNNNIEMKPENLMWDISQPTRYVTTDAVAKMIIEKDPLYQLVDVRPDYDYEYFRLPGAYNIPIDSLLTETADLILDTEDINTIFYSDDDLKSDQAWVIAKRMGYDNVYVLKGGINRWIETIIQPKAPAETDPITAFEKYEFRKGASMFFTGAEITVDNDTKQSLNITRRKKETVAEGGC